MAAAATSWSSASRRVSGASSPRRRNKSFWTRFLHAYRCPLRSKTLSRLVHAAAEASDQPQRPRRPAVAVAAQEFADALLDRLDQGFGLFADHQDELVESFEPAHLQELLARHIENERGDADAREFREDKNGDGR